MKRIFAAALLPIVMVFVLTACAGKDMMPFDEKSAGVMSYDEYVSAELNSEVTVETYVQCADSWWDGKITLYTQDQEGAYFIFDMSCTEEEAARLVPGTKIKVTGTKSEWSGEVAITDASFEIEEGSFIAQPKDVTDLLGKDELIDAMNQFVSFKGLTIEASTDADGNETPYLFKWDGSGRDGDDICFNASKDGQTYTFLVRTYLTGPETDVYKTAKTLRTGDTIDCEGFLCWYDGANPHVTSITVNKP